MGTIYGVEIFVPRVLAHGEPGHVVNTASIGGFQVRAELLTGAYADLKYGIVALTEALAGDLADTNVGVSILAPAAVNTGIYGLPDQTPAELREGMSPIWSGAACSRRSATATCTCSRISHESVARAPPCEDRRVVRRDRTLGTRRRIARPAVDRRRRLRSGFAPYARVEGLDLRCTRDARVVGREPDAIACSAIVGVTSCQRAGAIPSARGPGRQGRR